MRHEGAVRPRLALRDAVFLFALAIAISLFGSVASAHAAGAAVFSTPVPAAGAAALTKPTQIVLMCDDTAPVVSATIKVNGVSARTWTTNPVGHWEYNDDAECDVFILDDPTVVMMGSYKDSWTIVNGTNTVVATVISGSGVSTYSWTFEYVKDTTVTSVTPAPASVLPASPAAITASLTSPYAAFTSAMRVDGVLVSTAYSAPTKTFTCTPGAALQPGMHTVVFTATAAAGTATKTWSFKVAPPMSSGSDCTSCHATYPAAHSKNVCAPCHDKAWASPGQHGDAVPTVAGCMGPTANGVCHTLDHSGYMGKGLVGFTCNE